MKAATQFATLLLLGVALLGCKRDGAGPASESSVAGTAPTPVGVWWAVIGETKTSLQFSGGAAGGTYSQLVEASGQSEREFGHWVPDGDGVRMLIMATDRRDHPRFGKDVHFQVRYFGPDAIIINGPDRPEMRFVRAPAGTTVDVAPRK